MIEENFMDELLAEADKREQEQTEAYFDLVLLQIKNFTDKIERNFSEADKECALIKNFALMKNAQLQEKIKFLEMKLEAFIRERKEKTIALCNGTLKLHKKPDKVEITDLELFLKKANKDLVTIIPENYKPDLNKIKAYIKTKPTPAGVTVIEGKEEFTYKLRKEEINDGEEEAGASVESASTFRNVV